MGIVIDEIGEVLVRLSVRMFRLLENEIRNDECGRHIEEFRICEFILSTCECLICRSIELKRIISIF